VRQSEKKSAGQERVKPKSKRGGQRKKQFDQSWEDAIGMRVERERRERVENGEREERCTV
jgi:hypothetical protein